MTMAKGLTSAYLPLGAVGMRREFAEHFENNVFYGGLTYNSHPMACAAALATIAVYEEDGLIERAAAWARLNAPPAAGRQAPERRRSAQHRPVRDPRAGARPRELGADGALQRHSDEMKAVAKHLRDNGLYTFVRWNTIITNPPLTITEDELAEGFEIIDAHSRSPMPRSSDRRRSRLDRRGARPRPGCCVRRSPASRGRPSLGVRWGSMFWPLEAAKFDRRRALADVWARRYGTRPGAPRSESGNY